MSCFFGVGTKDRIGLAERFGIPPENIAGTPEALESEREMNEVLCALARNLANKRQRRASGAVKQAQGTKTYDELTNWERMEMSKEDPETFTRLRAESGLANE